MRRKTGIVLGAVVVFGAAAIIGFQFTGTSYAQEHNHGGQHMMAQEPQSAKPGLPSLEMIHSMQLPAVQKAIEEAIAQIEAGNKIAALAQLKRAQLSLKLVRDNLGMYVKPKFVNNKCPIMGGLIDPTKVAANLTRTYKGQKVAFCCAACPTVWDRLTDAQKDAKLRPVLVEASGQHDMDMHVMPMFVNSKCPIMGGSIDPTKVAANLTRKYKDQNVAFCCGNCPAAWDRLTDAQKDAKLKPVLLKTTEGHSIQEHSGHMH